MTKFFTKPSFSIIVFCIISYLLFIIKLNSLFLNYEIYNTSGAEVSTLNFLYNILNNNNFYLYPHENIFYEVYGINFHLFYSQFIKVFSFFEVDYKLSSRLLTLIFSLIIPIFVIKIYELVYNTKIKLNFYLYYFIILGFVISHQISSWWILTYRPDVLAILFSLLSVYLFLKYLDTKSLKFLVFSSILLVYAWTLKQNFLYVPVSIVLFFLIKKDFKILIFFFFFCLISILFLNLITGFNNLELLNRSVSNTKKYFIFKDYFPLLIKYLIQNFYIIPLIIINIGAFFKIRKTDKGKFIILCFFLLFFQCSIVATLLGAGRNHMMLFSIINLISIPILITSKKQLIKKIIFFSFLFSNLLMMFQIYNFNTFGRLSLVFDKKLKNQKYKLIKNINNNFRKPALFFGISGRFEMLLLEENNGFDTHQITSFKDPLWNQFMFYSDKRLDNYKVIYSEKIKKVSTVIIINQNNIKN